MERKISIHDLVTEVLGRLGNEGYTEDGIRQHKRTYKEFVAYADANGIDQFSEAVCIRYLSDRFGVVLEDRGGNRTDAVNRKVCHLKALWHYQEHGTIHFARTRPKKPAFRCPEPFVTEYAGYLEYCRVKQYTRQGLPAMLYPVKNFLLYLDQTGVRSLRDVSAETISGFISLYIDHSHKYVATVLSSLRSFFHCLYEAESTDRQLWLLLPKIRYTRDAFIPASWKKADVLRLLAAVDRGNPCGKRNYAILLVLVRLGLRASDIRNLKLGNLDWERKRVVMTMTKTRTPLVIPLLDDVGWAIIDYLRNGRPQTDSDCVFVTHRNPAEPFSFRSNFQRALHAYMRIAGLTIPREEHCGLHSLRATLARTMLENGAALPVISEVLGHVSTMSTSHYLKINLDALRQCAMDPEEVFCIEK